MRNGKMIMTGLLLLACVTAAHANDMRDVVRDETTGTVVHSSSGACVRTQWMNDEDVCADQVVAPAYVQQSTLSREERTVYFAFNQASLSPEMKKHLDTLAYRLKSEHNVRGARIVGYADRIGDPGYNEKLSKRRAENTRKYLVARGILNVQVAETRWLGSKTTVTDCPSDLDRAKLISCLQADRRVEVEIDYYAEHQSAE